MSGRPADYSDQLDGATLEEVNSAETFEITGRGTVYVIAQNIANKKALRGRVIKINGIPMKVSAFESCLIPGHDEAHCPCFNGEGLLAKEVD